MVRRGRGDQPSDSARSRRGQQAARCTRLEDLVRLVSAAPTKIYGLYPGKGSLQVGADADFTLVDLEHHWRIDQSRLHAKHAISPFHDWQVQGRAVATYVRGAPVMREGALLPGALGRFLRPTSARGAALLANA